MRKWRRSGDKKKSSSGQAPILAAVLFLLLVPTTIIIAENATLNITGSAISDISTCSNPPNSTEPDTCNDTLSDNANASLSEGQHDDYAGPGASETESMNSSQSPLNESIANQTPLNTSASTPVPEHAQPTPNQTSPEGAQNHSLDSESMPPAVESGDDNQSQETPALAIEIISPEKMTRGESAVIRAVLRNSGGPARNVTIKWLIPGSFDVVEGNDSHSLAELPSGDSFAFEIEISSSLDTHLGGNDVKVEVFYE